MKKITLLSIILSASLFASVEEVKLDKNSTIDSNSTIADTNATNISPEVLAIKAHFKDKIERVSFEAWAKGMGVNYSTKEFIKSKAIKAYGKEIGDIVRKTRGVKGKVEVCYLGTEKKKINKCAKF